MLFESVDLDLITIICLPLYYLITVLLYPVSMFFYHLIMYSYFTIIQPVIHILNYCVYFSVRSVSYNSTHHVIMILYNAVL